MATISKGTEGEEIPLALAAQWTANYRNQNPKGIKALVFGNKILRKTLKQKGCVGIRFYFAIDDTGAQQLVIVGVDKNGNDMYNGLVGDRAIPCPPYCDASDSPLCK